MKTLRQSVSLRSLLYSRDQPLISRDEDHDRTFKDQVSCNIGGDLFLISKQELVRRRQLKPNHTKSQNDLILEHPEFSGDE